MSMEESTPDNSQPFDWVDLVAGIRAGEEQALLRLGNIFQGGIHYFLRRVLGGENLQRRQREVLALVIKSIKENSIENPNHLASHVLGVLHQYISSQTTADPDLALVNELRVNIKNVRAIREFLAKIAAVDREALRRYYVEKETSEQICQTLHFTSGRFHAVRRSLRTALTPQGELIG
jgi:hypothetical protein